MKALYPPLHQSICPPAKRSTIRLKAPAPSKSRAKNVSCLRIFQLHFSHFLPRKTAEKHKKTSTRAFSGSRSQPFSGIFQTFRPLSNIENGIKSKHKLRKQLSIFALLFESLCAHKPVTQVVRRVGRGGGSWAGGSLCGLRCGAQPWGGGAELTALCRGQSSVQTAAPNLMLKCAWRRTARPTACAPRHRPSRLPHTPPAAPLGWRVGTSRVFQCALGDRAAVCGYSAFTAAPARADLARREIAQNREGKMIDTFLI